MYVAGEEKRLIITTDVGTYNAIISLTHWKNNP